MVVEYNMQYKSINEQIEKAIEILKMNTDLMKILDYISELKLPNSYIAAGSVFQTIWNYYDNKPLNYGIKDIDIVYYDKDNTSKDSEHDLENKIIDHFKELDYEFDVHNEARMYLWKKENENQNIDSFKNSEDAIDQWIATVHAIGITKENGNVKIYAPYGLSDIFSRTIRPIKHKNNSKEIYDKKVASWSNRFDNLNIVEW